MWSKRKRSAELSLKIKTKYKLGTRENLENRTIPEKFGPKSKTEQSLDGMGGTGRGP